MSKSDVELIKLSAVKQQTTNIILKNLETKWVMSWNHALVYRDIKTVQEEARKVLLEKMDVIKDLRLIL